MEVIIAVAVVSLLVGMVMPTGARKAVEVVQEAKTPAAERHTHSWNTFTEEGWHCEFCPKVSRDPKGKGLIG